MTWLGLVGLLFIHAVVCCVVAILMWQGIIRAPGTFLVIVVLVPVVGIVSMLFVDLTLRRKPDPQAGEAVLNVGKGTTPFGMITVDGSDAQPVVPLEEALLINDVRTRRAILQDILRRDPSRYVELLKVARLNDDMEVTHYATTTMMEIQRDFELSLQRLDKEIKSGRDDGEASDLSIELLDRYVSSGLLEGYPQERMRLKYLEALEQKTELSESDRLMLMRLAENRLALSDYESAASDIDRVVSRWPADEDAWLLGLRIKVESCDKKALDSWLGRMAESPVVWSAKGRGILEFWQSAKPGVSSGKRAGSAVVL